MQLDWNTGESKILWSELYGLHLLDWPHWIISAIIDPGSEMARMCIGMHASWQDMVHRAGSYVDGLGK